MLPPLEDTILQSNPKFAALHTILTKNLLNPSGSTKHEPAQKERDAVSEDLKKARTQYSKSHLLLTSLKSLDLSPLPPSKRDPKRDAKPAPKALPAELIELILILSSHLMHTSPASTKLLESTSQWATLPDHLPAISALLSTHLQTQALALARIANPSTNASYLHRGIPKIFTHVRDVQSSISASRGELETRRAGLASKTNTLLGIYHLTISLIIRILEGSKHGQVSRHIRSKSEFLNVQARTSELEMSEKAVRGRTAVYTEEVRRALEAYAGELRMGSLRAEERRGEAERILWGYGVGRNEEKEMVMRTMARAWKDVERELEEVGRDVERLKGR